MFCREKQTTQSDDYFGLDVRFCSKAMPDGQGARRGHRKGSASESRAAERADQLWGLLLVLKAGGQVAC